MKDKIGYYMIYCKYWLLTWVNIIPFVIRNGVFKTIGDLRRYPWIITLLKVNRLLVKLGKGRPRHYQKATAIIISGIVPGLVEILEGMFSSPDKVIIHEDMVPPEIFRAMGLSPFMAELMGIVMPMLEPHSMESYIDESESEGIPPDICSLPKSTMGLFLKGETPPATALVSSNLPCDGGMSSYSLIEKQLGLPAFRLDIPFHF